MTNFSGPPAGEVALAELQQQEQRPGGFSQHRAGRDLPRQPRVPQQPVAAMGPQRVRVPHAERSPAGASVFCLVVPSGLWCLKQCTMENYFPVAPGWCWAVRDHAHNVESPNHPYPTSSRCCGSKSSAKASVSIAADTATYTAAACTRTMVLQVDLRHCTAMNASRRHRGRSRLQARTLEHHAAWLAVPTCQNRRKDAGRAATNASPLIGNQNGEATTRPVEENTILTAGCGSPDARLWQW